MSISELPKDVKPKLLKCETKKDENNDALINAFANENLRFKDDFCNSRNRFRFVWFSLTI